MFIPRCVCRIFLLRLSDCEPNVDALLAEWQHHGQKLHHDHRPHADGAADARGTTVSAGGTVVFLVF